MSNYVGIRTLVELEGRARFGDGADFEEGWGGVLRQDQRASGVSKNATLSRLSSSGKL